MTYYKFNNNKKQIKSKVKELKSDNKNEKRYTEVSMSDDEVTMSIRKFLKKVGITSQQEIEKVYSGSGKVKVKMVLSCEELNLEHVIEGEIGKD